MRMAKTLQQRLDQANCDYDIIPHPHSATSLESARTAGVPAERVAKSVMLDDRMATTSWPCYRPTGTWT
jgi:hypothetical protein